MLALVAIGGLALAACGVYRATTGVRRNQRDSARLLALMRGFRRTVVGLCAAGLAAGWLWDLGWLIGLSLIIGGEEFPESTMMIATLSRQRAGAWSAALPRGLPARTHRRRRGSDALQGTPPPAPQIAADRRAFAAPRRVVGGLDTILLARRPPWAMPRRSTAIARRAFRR